jgi:hypothetical protein
MEELCDLRKSTVHKILDDDYTSKDSVEGSLKLVGNSEKGENFMKYNNSFNVSTSDGAFAFKYSDNVEVRTNLFGKNLKGKIKNGRFTEHWDLGLREWNTTFRGESKTVWFNPYFRWGATTSLTNVAFHLGLQTYWCPHFNERLRLNYNPVNAVDGNSAWSLCSRKRFTYGKFWADGCGGFNFGKFTEFTLKKLRMGYNESNWGVTLQANTIQPFQGGCPLKDSVSLGASYTHKSLGTLAARVKHFMDERAMAFNVGLQRKVKDCATVKLKVDQDMNLNVNAKMSCSKSGLSFEPNLMTNLTDSDKVSGVLDLPIKFGLKVKLSR